MSSVPLKQITGLDPLLAADLPTSDGWIYLRNENEPNVANKDKRFDLAEKLTNVDSALANVGGGEWALIGEFINTSTGTQNVSLSGFDESLRNMYKVVISIDPETTSLSNKIGGGQVFGVNGLSPYIFDATYSIRTGLVVGGNIFNGNPDLYSSFGALQTSAYWTTGTCYYHETVFTFNPTSDVGFAIHYKMEEHDGIQQGANFSDQMLRIDRGVLKFPTPVTNFTALSYTLLPGGYRLQLYKRN
jgi:hypothetical protein